MPNYELKINGANVILVGAFNPSIFQPQWLVSEGLISKDEGKSAEIQIIHPEISQFLVNKINYQITRDRCVLDTQFEPRFKIIKDLIQGIFGLLHFTPIHMMGINRDFHFYVNSKEDYHRFGHTLAPKTIWKEILKEPGMSSIAVEGIRTDNYRGKIVIKAEPSNRIGENGIYIRVNDHYEFGDKETTKDSSEMIKVLQEKWEVSLTNAEKFVEKLMEATRPSDKG